MEFGVWLISLSSILLMLIRPFRLAEAYWIGAGAMALLIFQLISWSRAESAVLKGMDVYLFLIGMMILSDLAREKGVFDWMASVAARLAGGSPSRLFFLVYGTGTLVTIILSNDATAVVLTPAVLTLVQRLKVNAKPYALVCAFIANAASFVLPISNPANLVVYAKGMPPLGTWISEFALPSLASITVTFIVLRWLLGQEIAGKIHGLDNPQRLSFEGALAFSGLIVGALVLLTVSALGGSLGLATLGIAVFTIGIISVWDHSLPISIAKSLSWSVIPLVAGLFVIVEALQQAGLSEMARGALNYCGRLSPELGHLAAAFGTAIVSNGMNNLPIGLAVGSTIQSTTVSSSMTGALLIGVDLGPNLSVTGSLATILWLIALRREKVTITAWEFLRVGLIAMPLALLASVLVLL